ncbi:NACHT, LRR and PYD domains-containing protein 3-like [Patiria miniata]|uniref:Uncharacterized protein n=1 Tax=Patiria miniata TaxID=46514 RepID=A0A914BKU7_PATMI|nr:NACHT, LRR and PYD domains-containing protein 3-like [Patiria miniata]
MDPSKEPLDDFTLSALADKLGKDWLKLARRLGLTAARIDVIKADNPLNTVNQIMEMLVTWRRTLGQDDDSFGILAEGLKKVGRTDLAEELLVNQKANSPSAFEIRALRAELAEHYLNTTCKVPTHPVFPAWVRDMSGIYVDMNLIEENDPPCGQPSTSASASKERTMERCEKIDQKKKVRLGSHEDLVGLDGAGKYRVLLKGRPGSGKTTVIKKITYDWSSLEESGDESSQLEAEAAKSDNNQESKSRSAFSKFTLLFPLKVNQMTHDKSIVDSISRQILARDTKVSKVGLKNFIETRQEEILFLLDGLDEIPASVFEEGDNVLKDLLTGRILRRCCVIVTSRHHRAHQLLKSYPHFAKVETTGFGSRERDSYVKKYFASAQDQTQLITEMESSATLRHLAAIPLLLLMMCLVFASQSTLPKRLTKLYENVIQTLLMHQAAKHGAPSKQNQRSQVPHQLMNRLGQVALEGLLRSGGEKLVFSEYEFSQEDIAEGCDIGLLVQDIVPDGLEVESKVTFLHKSFQELCAASYLAELAKTSKKQFKKYLASVTVDTVGNMEYLLRFCCGKSTRAAKLVLHHVKKLQKRSLYFERGQSQRLRLILAFEAKSKHLKSFLSDVTSFPLLKGEHLLAANCFLQNVGCLSQVRKLSVACESSTEMGLVMSMLSHTPHVQDLICHRGAKDTTPEEASVKIPRLRQLTTVYFFDSPAVQASGHSSSLVPRFLAKQANMTHVHLLGVDMHGWVGALQPHVRTVKSLCLSNAGLLTADTSGLFDMLTAASSMKVLNLSGNSLNGSLHALVCFVSSLERLDLSNCDIQEDDAESLANVLSAATSLKRLSLSYNNMHGRVDLLVPVVPHLDTLHLDYCGLQESDAHSLSLLLPSAENLRKLHLLYNSFDNIENIKCMICMKVLTNTYLVLSYDVFGWTYDL